MVFQSRGMFLAPFNVKYSRNLAHVKNCFSSYLGSDFGDLPWSNNSTGSGQCASTFIKQSGFIGGRDIAIVVRPRPPPYLRLVVVKRGVGVFGRKRVMCPLRGVFERFQ